MKSVSKLLLLGLLAVCSVSALSKELVTDVDAHRTKVRHNCWAWWEARCNHTGQHCSTFPSFSTLSVRERPSLRPLILALMEMCNWSPTHKTSSGGAPVKENGCPTGKDMWAFRNPLVTVTSLLPTHIVNTCNNTCRITSRHKHSALLSFPLVCTLPSPQADPSSGNH